jgi:hypothetical protein
MTSSYQFGIGLDNPAYGGHSGPTSPYRWVEKLSGQEIRMQEQKADKSWRANEKERHDTTPCNEVVISADLESHMGSIFGEAGAADSGGIC